MSDQMERCAPVCAREVAKSLSNIREEVRPRKDSRLNQRTSNFETSTGGHYVIVVSQTSAPSKTH